MSGPNILLFDIETAPLKCYTWGTYQVNAIKVIEDWYVLCWCAKWLDEKRVWSSALVDHRDEYRNNPRDDKQVCLQLWHMLDDADIVIAHNANKFDVKKMNARFIQHGMKPPSPFKVIDTLQVARSHFAFTSNRLDDLGEALGVGRKLNTGGFELWENCMAGNKKAWRDMVKYCKQDVVLLEKVYLALRPWMPRHPNMGVYNLSDEAVCAHCGGKDLTPHTTPYYTNSSQYEKYECNSCHGWSRRRRAIGVQAKVSKAPSNIACDRK